MLRRITPVKTSPDLTGAFSSACVQRANIQFYILKWKSYLADALLMQTALRESRGPVMGYYKAKEQNVMLKRRTCAGITQ